MDDLAFDAVARVEFVGELSNLMGVKNLGADEDVLFHSVNSVGDLYDKCLVQVVGFPKWIGDEDDDDEEEEEEEQEKKREQRPNNKQPAKTGTAVSLATLIDANEEEEEVLANAMSAIVPVQIAARTHTPGRCIECEEREAILDCSACEDEFCGVCFAALHRKGKRASHTTKPKPGHAPFKPLADASAPASAVREDEIEFPLDLLADEAPLLDDRDFTFRAQFIPIRLQGTERTLLRLLEAQLAVSTYTDAIDKPTLQNNKRVHAQIMKICSFLSGLATSVDYEEGRQMVQNRHWKKHEAFFRKMLELGRRYKILNPDRMRSEYGRLMYMMMDAMRNDVQQLLGFNVNAPLLTVHSFLKAHGAEKMLVDPRMEIATRAIDQMDQLMDEARKKSRQEIRREVKEKEAAVKALARQYSVGNLREDDIKWCLYSIGDNRTFLLQHRDPVTRMIRYLQRYFGPEANVAPEYSLAIFGGEDGARLTHSHERQYAYVLQSLTLWREIINDMFRLWCLAEEDMLDPACPYDLQDTGQGYQRVQAAPRVAKAMRDLLFRVQGQLGSWVGSSVVHLGDKNVPNALQFLDKYTQVARILSPITICLDALPELCQNDKTAAYIDQVFGGVEKCRKDMLLDFFKSAFDGSGADNFFDAGSCIDGRLTSAWNWCNHISEKKFFPVLKLSGWSTFDGIFQE